MLLEPSIQQQNVTIYSLRSTCIYVVIFRSYRVVSSRDLDRLVVRGLSIIYRAGDGSRDLDASRDLDPLRDLDGSRDRGKSSGLISLRRDDSVARA